MVSAGYESRGLDTFGILLLAEVAAGTIPNAPLAVWAPVANVQGVSGPTPTLSFAETTEPEGTWREFEPQQIDPGEISLTILYNPAMATHTYLLDALRNRESRRYAIVEPLDDGDTQADRDRWEFNAYVQSFVPGGTLDGLRVADVRLRASGALVFPSAGTEYPGVGATGEGYPLT